MEYMNFCSDKNEAKILCCQCGVPIPPNPANMCVGCLRTRVDITEGIPKQVTIYFCKGCERFIPSYHNPDDASSSKCKGCALNTKIEFHALCKAQEL